MMCVSTIPKGSKVAIDTLFETVFLYYDININNISKRQSVPLVIMDNMLIKWDLLAIDALQKEHICLNLLLQDGYIKWQGTLKDTYEKYLGVYNIERDNPQIWEMINKHKIISLFQMEKQSGYQAISIGHPESLVDLSALNSVMRLMAPEPGAESPLERYGRFKKDITLWYDEMTRYGLNEHEQEVVRKYAEKTYGLLPNQENFMLAVQDPEIGGFDLLWSDRLRKSIAKVLAH